ncbi:hypothetical protein WDA79_07585 [Streptomyces sp. A475]|uniref:hypothetical protein n=1 Tax=unclassified Streptomyces TaxID=2593676 RepID=UPI0030C9018F
MGPPLRLDQRPVGVAQETDVYWNGWAARLIQSLAGPDNVELRLVWSADPTAEPYPRPMGF